jgi:hypothetical protein
MTRIALIVSLVLVTLASIHHGIRATSSEESVGSRPLEPQAGEWQTYVLTSGSEIAVPAPPGNGSATTQAELEEVKNPSTALPVCPGTLGPQTSDPQQIIDFWNASPPFKPWTEIQLKLIIKRGMNTPRAHRGLALSHAGIYDGVIATWNWKYTYHRPRPDQLDDSIEPAVEAPLHPSYPSEHAAIAGVAAGVLAQLFPGDAGELNCLRDQAAQSRLHAKVNYPSDISAGLALGASVAALVKTRRADTDGSTVAWNCTTEPLPKTGIGFWQTTSDPANSCPETGGRQPTDPRTGMWATWVISEPALTPPPPNYETYGTTAVCGAHATAAAEGKAAVQETRKESDLTCDDAVSDEPPGFGDTFVNDGCPGRALTSEAGVQCDGAADDDGDGFVNEGCPRVGLSSESGAQCANATDDDLDGKINDGCAVGEQATPVAEAGSDCNNSSDDDGDGYVNEGCPALGAAETVGAQCNNRTDDDGDGTVNDGCASPGPQCGNAIDDDGDGRINDGCPAVGDRNALINRWGGAPGNRWNLIMLPLLSGLNTPRAARISALVNTGGADSLYSSWRAKFAYATGRLQNLVAQQCAGFAFFDAAFTPVRATPRDPSYTSGLSTVSGAVSEILAFFFPDAADAIRSETVLARESRIFDGTHWRYDNDAGYAAGVAIAPAFIERASNDGAQPVR